MSAAEELKGYRSAEGLYKISTFSAFTDEYKEFEKLVKEGKPLPEGVYYDVSANGGYGACYKTEPSGLSSADVAELLAHRQTAHLKSIKNMLTFFTVLTILGLAAGAITLLATML